MDEAVFTTASGYNFLRIRLNTSQGIYAHGSPVYARLCIPVELISIQHENLVEILVQSVQVKLSMSTIGELSDSIFLSVNRTIVMSMHPPSLTEMLEIPLDHYRVEHIERHRDADLQISLRFVVACALTWKRGSGVTERREVEFLAQSQDVQHTIAQKKWTSEILNGLGHGIVHIVEIPVAALSADSILKDSFAALRKAEHLFKLGFYNEAVGSCRIALDPLFKERVKRREKPTFKKEWSERFTPATVQWLEESLQAIRSATSDAHHQINAGFERLDAQMVLMVTIALVSYASRKMSPES